MNETTSKQNDQIEALFKAGAHFGFSKSRRHPSMAPFIFGVKNKVEIFDLEKVSTLLEEAKTVMKGFGNGRKKVLFVGGKNEARAIIKDAAIGAQMPYVAGRWIGGTLTNYSEIKKRINRLADLTEKREKGQLDKFTKLEQLHIDREIEDLDRVFGGLKGMEKLPDAVVVVDSKHEEIAVAEARKMNIPVIGILNSDCNSGDVDTYIPGNDSSVASITYLVNELVSAYEEGVKHAPAPEAKKEEKTIKAKV